MRLTTIKLAGFKSFVDPTTIRFPTAMTSIVGPNGCGKSNIIDAVRWVMGESSARQLRGESMSDVIFNGSGSRKPVAQASVELLFDNSDGRAGGEYAAFSEISVKRQVSRDGQSQYYLNGSRCRRRDITDLFLGTGLGPRSYSIIEQGMISQIVEARPEDLRQYLEEAAGISKYRERRRETENRIAHTRDNLARLSDLRDEVGKHLDRLQRQARAAERYKKLQLEHRRLNGRKLAGDWQAAHARALELEAKGRQHETELQAAIARLRHAEAENDKLGEDRGTAQETFNQAQAAVYEIGGKIARCEQEIAHHREMVKRQTAELEQVTTQRTELEGHLQADQAALDQALTAEAEIQPALATARQRLEQAAAAAAAAEQALKKAEAERQAQQQRLAACQRERELAATRSEHLERQLHDDRQRHATLAAELVGLERTAHEQSLAAAQARLAELTALNERAQRAHDEAQTELHAARARCAALGDELNSERQQLSALGARLESLTAVQLSALGAADERRAEWLAPRGLSQARRLAATIEADETWVEAIETVLGDWLQAVMTPADSTLLAAELAATDDLTLTVMDAADSTADDPAFAPASLASRCRGPLAMRRLLAAIECAADLDAALERLPALPPGGSLITPDGTWLGAGWIRVKRAGSSESGTLKREQTLRATRADLAAAERRAGELEEQLAAARSALEQCERRLEVTRVALDEARRDLAGQQVTVSTGTRRIEEIVSRETRLQEESQRLSEKMTTAEKQWTDDRARVEEYDREIAELQAAEARLETDLAAAGDAVQTAAHALEASREECHAQEIKSEGLRSSAASLRQALDRAERQRAQLLDRQQKIESFLAAGDAPETALQADLDRLLKARLAADRELTACRSGLEALVEQQRQFEQQRQSAARDSDACREQLEAARLAAQEEQLTARNLARQIEALAVDETLEQLVESLPDAAEQTGWDDELARLERRIARLEPVNLAAISEYEQESERKRYLDAQDSDLNEALSTLEKAIARIDRTTRSRFGETFERVNRTLETMFPRLFGGGHAYLEMTSNDLLTTGVVLMARPPGKRNTSIHLLSGGEKALTAVAFVFAIFNLNPAPFCMLDEVDAPLDDANVSRFSALVTDLAEQVQFIIVTHNKTTMEGAQQLLGVTMREPGVSRLVSVDLEEAAALAAR